MKNRLEQFLRSQGLTSVKFAEIMQIQPSSVSHILAGRNNPNFDFISRMLSRFPELNPDWIINGTGDIYRRNNTEVIDNVTNVNNDNITAVTQDNDRTTTTHTTDYEALKLPPNTYKSSTNEPITNVIYEPKIELKSPSIFDTLTEGARDNSRNDLFTVETQENIGKLPTNSPYLNDFTQKNDNLSATQEQSVKEQNPRRVEQKIDTDLGRNESNTFSNILADNTAAKKIIKIVILYSDSTCKVYDSLD